MHKLLLRQLKRFLSAEGMETLPPAWQPFVQAVDAAYTQADTDRELLERAVELTSSEMQERYETLLKEIATRRQVEEFLKRTNDALVKQNKIMFDREERILDLKLEVNQLLAELHRDKKYKI